MKAKMTSVLRLLMIISAGLTIHGCADTADKPKDVGEKFIHARLSGDYDLAAEYVVAPRREDFRRWIAEQALAVVVVESIEFMGFQEGRRGFCYQVQGDFDHESPGAESRCISLEVDEWRGRPGVGRWDWKMIGSRCPDDVVMPEGW